MTGMIVCHVSGLYTVLADDRFYSCRARGIFRKNNISPVVGDKVVFTPLPAGEGVIEQIEERQNSFIRPCISNVDMLCYVLSSRSPEPDPYLIDKMTVLCALKNVEILLVLNKTDLDSDGSAAKLLAEYEKIGFSVIRLCAITGEGIPALRDAIHGKRVVLCGNTGVGKSSLVNALEIGVNAKVSEISQKLGRGRHTTREVTLFPYGKNSFLADTPGFGNVDLTLETSLAADTLAPLFRDFVPWITGCRFADCTHTEETGCLIREKMREGLILSSRYQSYCRIFQDLTRRDSDQYK